MTEKMYDLKIPNGCMFQWADGPDGEATIHRVTKEYARSLRLQCQEIEDEVEPTAPTAAEQPWTPKAGDKCLHQERDGTNRYEVILVGPDPQLPSNFVCQGPLGSGGRFFSTHHISVLRPLPPEPEKRVWRDWDILKATWSDHFAIRVSGKWASTWASGDDSYADNTMRDKRNIYVGNLPDILAQGEVPFFLKKDEIEILLSMRGKCGWESIVGKATDALVTYRKRRGVDQ